MAEQMIALERALPLAGRKFAADRVMASPLDAKNRYTLRMPESLVAKAGVALGCKLPTIASTSNSAKGVAVLWLGPDEWLVITDIGVDVAGKLSKLDAVALSVVDVSHRNTAIEISGRHAKIALNAGCPRDLSLDAFGVGACSRTIMGKAEIVLWRTADECFHVECWRSFANYVWAFLVDGARRNAGP